MSILLLRLAGPMQSWGIQSRFMTRDTGLEPTKSGVIGLICAALGWPRDQASWNAGDHSISLTELAGLRMGVRVDREGVMSRDFHTAGGGTLTNRHDGPAYGVIKASGARGTTVVSTRYYLADASFLVGLEGDRELLARLQAAVRQPAWPLFLGRKSFVPGTPIDVGPKGLIEDATLADALRSFEWDVTEDQSSRISELRLVLESNDSTRGEPRRDVPLSFDIADRRYAVRYVETDWIRDPQKCLPLVGKTPQSEPDERMEAS